MAAFVTHAGSPRLPDLTVVSCAIFDASLVPSPLAGDVDSLTGEIDVGDASGYARASSVAVTWNAGTQSLDIDTPPSFDLDGAPSVACVVWFDPADDQVISFSEVADHPGFDGWLADAGSVGGYRDGFSVDGQLADHAARITALEAAPGGGGIPDPSGEDDGDVLTVSSGAAVWAPPTGGGAPDTTGADPGDVLTVDTPGSPAVWAPPGGGSGWSLEVNGNLGVHTDGVLAIVAAYNDAPGPIDTPALVGAVPAGCRPADPETRRIAWHGGGMDFGDAVVVIDDDAGTTTSTPGGVMVMDLTGTLTGTDDVRPLLVGVTWLVEQS